MDIGSVERKGYKGTEIVIYRKTALCSAAELATRMIEKWGMIVLEEDGEDSQGRQKYSLATEEEVVQRACRIAELSMDEFRKRGWILDLPMPVIENDDL